MSLISPSQLLSSFMHSLQVARGVNTPMSRSSNFLALSYATRPVFAPYAFSGDLVLHFSSIIAGVRSHAREGLAGSRSTAFMAYGFYSPLSFHPSNSSLPSLLLMLCNSSTAGCLNGVENSSSTIVGCCSSCCDCAV